MLRFNIVIQATVIKRIVDKGLNNKPQQHIYIYAFTRRFIQSDLQCNQAIHFFILALCV